MWSKIIANRFTTIKVYRYVMVKVTVFRLLVLYWTPCRVIVQGDQLYMAMCFWCLVQNDASVRYCKVANTMDKSHFARYQKHTV